jgi:hypothetical protein
MNKIKELWSKLWVYIKPILTINKIWGFLTSKIFLVILVLILFILIGRGCSRIRELKRVNNIHEQNIVALTDTIKTEKTKSGKLQVSIAGYILSVKDLKDINGSLYKEVRDQKGTIISINKIVFQLKQDTFELRKHINYLESIMSQPFQINDTIYKISWLLKYDWDDKNFDVYKGQTFIGILDRKITRNTYTDMSKSFNNGFNNIFNESFILKHFKTEMVDRLTQVELTFGQKIEDKQLRIFVNTKYPGFTASSLEGVLIDPNTNPYIKELMKKKKWFPNTWSVGGGPSFGYNFLTGKPYLGVGVQINYNILQW